VSAVILNVLCPSQSCTSYIDIPKPEDLFELVRKDDIDNIMKDFTITRLHYVATNGITGFIGGAVEKMDEEMFELYLKHHYSVCEREDMVGVTHHSLDILKKE